jgi:hypothetical protein
LAILLVAVVLPMSSLPYKRGWVERWNAEAK